MTLQIRYAVELAKGKDTQALREAIRKKEEPRLDRFAVSELEVWAVAISLSDEGKGLVDKAEEAMKEEPFLGRTRLGDIFIAVNLLLPSVTDWLT